MVLCRPGLLSVAVAQVWWRRGPAGDQMSPLHVIAGETPALPLKLLEASSGFEPLNEGFADPCLTTWLRRPIASLLEAPSRFELLNEGFADPSLSHLGTAPSYSSGYLAAC